LSLAAPGDVKPPMMPNEMMSILPFSQQPACAPAAVAKEGRKPLTE